MSYTTAQIEAVEAKIAALNVKKFSALGLTVDEVAELKALMELRTHMSMGTSATITCGAGKVQGFDA